MQVLNSAGSRLIDWLRANENGQTLVEYGFIISLVSVALILTLGALATGIDGVFDTIIAGLP